MSLPCPKCGRLYTWDGRRCTRRDCRHGLGLWSRLFFFLQKFIGNRIDEIGRLGAVLHPGDLLRRLLFRWRNRLPAAAAKVLCNAYQFELLSIYPDPRSEVSGGQGTFHGYPVLGRTAVTQSSMRKAILQAVEKGLAEHDDSRSRCVFEPRHAIHAADGKSIVDVLICFTCHDVLVIGPNGERQGLLITGSPRPLLDKILSEAGIPLAG
jgi:hypothetical protein